MNTKNKDTTTRKPRLYVLFNHQVTPIQEAQAKADLGVSAIHALPDPLLRLWAALPPDAAALRPVLEPVLSWIGVTPLPGDYLLVQGDVGACFLVAQHARDLGLIPVYATTRRQASEMRLDNGSVRMIHTFEHVRFREYGK